MRKLVFAIIILHFSILISMAQWIQMSNGLSTSAIDALAKNESTVFAGTIGYGIFISTNYGNSWSQTTLDTSTFAFTVSGSYIFSGTPTGVYYSTNNGQNWYQTSLSNRIVGALTVSGSNIIAGSIEYGAYISTNNGINWNQTSLNNLSVVSLETNENYVFAGTSFYGVFISSDGGQNWIQTSLNNRTVPALAVSGNNIFAGTFQFGVYLSTNNGQNWVQTSLNDKLVYALAISGSNVFAGTWYEGVFVSTDFGVNWVPHNEGLVTQTVRSLVISSAYIFAGTDSTVWRRNLSELVSIRKIPESIPLVHVLSQNYPNPFNPVTIINYQLPIFSHVKLIIYDVLGKEIDVLVNEKQSAGTYQVEWDGSNYPSGVYFYKLFTDDYAETRKMVLIK